MRIGIDAREAFHPKPTGKGTWARHVIDALERRGIDLVLFGKGETKNFSWHLRTAWKLLHGKNVDLYLSPTSYLVPWLLGKSLRTAIVIHDLIAFQREPHDRKATIIERLTLPRALRNASWIFCVSEATKRELLEHFPQTDPKKITVVYEGPSVKKPETRNQKPENPNSQFSIPHSPFVLSIGTLCPRKNQLRLIQAFRMLRWEVRKNTTLILVGQRGWSDAEIIALAKETPNVEWRGYVSDGERDALLCSATVFAYPSLAEGFGLPVLDALTLGIPTLTSNRSSLPEVAGDSALLVNPENTEAIAKGLEELLASEKLRETLGRKGPLQASKFRWERTVDLMMEAFVEV